MFLILLDSIVIIICVCSGVILLGIAFEIFREGPEAIRQERLKQQNNRKKK